MYLRTVPRKKAWLGGNYLVRVLLSCGLPCQAEVVYIDMHGACSSNVLGASKAWPSQLPALFGILNLETRFAMKDEHVHVFLRRATNRQTHDAQERFASVGCAVLSYVYSLGPHQAVIAFHEQGKSSSQPFTVSTDSPRILPNGASVKLAAVSTDKEIELTVETSLPVRQGRLCDSQSS